MDTFQIKIILSKQVGSIVKGMYARDQLLSLKMCAPSCYVINTKPSSLSGEHWLAVYVRHDQTAVYFDSVGFPPDQTTIIKFLKKHTVKWIYSRKCFKIRSRLCVERIVLCFLLNFHRFKNLRRFLNQFNCDMIENNSQVLNFVKKSYHLNIPLFITEL